MKVVGSPATFRLQHHQGHDAAIQHRFDPHHTQLFYTFLLDLYAYPSEEIAVHCIGGTLKQIKDI